MVIWNAHEVFYVNNFQTNINFVVNFLSISLTRSLSPITMEEVKLAFSLCFYEKWILFTINSVQLNELRCSFGWIKMTWNIVQFLGMVWWNLIFLFAAKREREKGTNINFLLCIHMLAAFLSIQHFSFTQQSEALFWKIIVQKLLHISQFFLYHATRDFMEAFKL